MDWISVEFALPLPDRLRQLFVKTIHGNHDIFAFDIDRYPSLFDLDDDLHNKIREEVKKGTDYFEALSNLPEPDPKPQWLALGRGRLGLDKVIPFEYVTHWKFAD